MQRLWRSDLSGPVARRDPSRTDRYTIGKVLGQGGFGITYQGANTLLKSAVAIKELFPAGAGRHGSTVRPPTDAALEVQTEKTQEWLTRRGISFRDEMVFVDDGYSGGNMDRPTLKRLREGIAAGKVQVVVGYKLDRLSRSVMDAVNLVIGEWDGKCILNFTVEEIDTSTQQGKQIFYMLASFAEWEHAMIRDRTYEGKLKRAQQGMNAGQKYPVGYKADEEHPGPGKKFALDGFDRKSKQLTGNAAQVREVFDQFLGGRSLSAIAHNLNERGVPCPDKGRFWRFGDIARIIDNPKYCGRYEYGRKPNGSLIHKIDEAVPAIVTLGAWECVRRSDGNSPPGSLGCV